MLPDPEKPEIDKYDHMESIDSYSESESESMWTKPEKKVFKSFIQYRPNTTLITNYGPGIESKNSLPDISEDIQGISESNSH